MTDEKKLILEPKLSADHHQLMAIIESCTAMIGKLAAASTDGSSTAESETVILQEFVDTFTNMDNTNREHFKEEETVTIVALRSAATPEEVLKNITLPIISDLTWEDLGHYYSPFSSEKIKAFAKQEGIPFFIVWSIKLNVWRYNSKYLKPADLAIDTAKNSTA